MAGIRIIADLFHAKFENLKVGAEWIRFSPSDRFEGGSVKLDIGTAGEHSTDSDDCSAGSLAV